MMSHKAELMATGVMCPMCGSSHVDATEEERHASAPYGPTVSYNIKMYRCTDCDEQGDFARKNDAIIQQAQKDLKKKSIEPILAYLVNTGASLAYIERALELPARTLNRWKTEGCSAGSIALLRLIRTYPWLLEVADADFDERVAKMTLVKETASIVGELLGEVFHSRKIRCEVHVSVEPQIIDAETVHSESSAEAKTLRTPVFKPLIAATS